MRVLVQLGEEPPRIQDAPDWAVAAGAFVTSKNRVVSATGRTVKGVPVFEEVIVDGHRDRTENA